jgi:hypothetical protein
MNELTPRLAKPKSAESEPLDQITSNLNQISLSEKVPGATALGEDSEEVKDIP